jgi:hypothetical protein
MMPGIWLVLVPVAPFPAAICPGELRAAERACLLADLGGYYGKRVVCHLRDLSALPAVRLAWRPGV